MKHLHLIRFYSAEQSTLGLLMLDQEFLCFIVEDEARAVKVFGETRIPAGTYKLGLRFSPKFSMRLGHKMIEIQGVPNFEFIYLHAGLFASHTNGCLLVGDAVVRRGPKDEGGSYILSGYTIPCYRRVYGRLRELMDSRELTHITISDQVTLPSSTPIPPAP